MLRFCLSDGRKSIDRTLAQVPCTSAQQLGREALFVYYDGMATGSCGHGIGIFEVRSAEDLRQARQLLEEYFAALEVDLGEVRRSEIASLPGEYAAPGGFML